MREETIKVWALPQEQIAWDEDQGQLGASFLQSAGWGSFQAAIGHSPHFISGEGWSCLLLERLAPLGKYLFAPYGPTVGDARHALAAMKEIKSYARRNDFDWLRLEPISQGDASGIVNAISAAGGHRAAREAEPHLTRIVDLNRSQEDILASLSQTTRNIIRRNQRESFLNFKSSQNPQVISIFSDMLKTVADRKNVGFFSDEYYAKQAEILMPRGMMTLELAFDGGKPVGSAVMHDYGDLCTYTYAASLPEARDKNVSALLLWQALINAKHRGRGRLDLYGIAPEGAGPDHPWYGFSDFKKKFGGQVVERAGTWDIPISSKYHLYRRALAARQLLRRRR
jgi:lipid II:glycine glycyltransferase (peptidoglycan interpeptide bridge formation enzyme)